MNKLQLDQNFSISEQITLDEVKQLAADGVKVLICNRPDAEEPNQLKCEAIKTVADENGIRFVHLPVAGRDIPETSLSEFTELLDNSQGKIHAYCRTGTRSSIFWGLSLARNTSPTQVLAKAELLGLNLTPISEQLDTVYQRYSS